MSIFTQPPFDGFSWVNLVKFAAITPANQSADQDRYLYGKDVRSVPASNEPAGSRPLQKLTHWKIRAE
jgi:hypothetical protein